MLPDPEGPIVQKQEKVYVPIHEHPNVSARAQLGVEVSRLTDRSESVLELLSNFTHAVTHRAAMVYRQQAIRCRVTSRRFN